MRSAAGAAAASAWGAPKCGRRVLRWTHQRLPTAGVLPPLWAAVSVPQQAGHQHAAPAPDIHTAPAALRAIPSPLCSARSAPRAAAAAAANRRRGGGGKEVSSPTTSVPGTSASFSSLTSSALLFTVPFCRGEGDPRGSARSSAHHPRSAQGRQPPLQYLHTSNCHLQGAAREWEGQGQRACMRQEMAPGAAGCPLTHEELARHFDAIR